MSSNNYVCLHCCRSVKSTCYYLSPSPCPECGQTTICAGPAFKAPRRHNRQQWRKVDLLLSAGIRFFYHERRPPLTTLRIARNYATQYRRAKERQAIGTGYSILTAAR